MSGEQVPHWGEVFVGKLNRKPCISSKSPKQKKAPEIAQSLKKWLLIELSDLKYVPVDAELCNLFSSHLMTGRSLCSSYSFGVLRIDASFTR